VVQCVAVCVNTESGVSEDRRESSHTHQMGEREDKLTCCVCVCVCERERERMSSTLSVSLHLARKALSNRWVRDDKHSHVVCV